MANLYYKIDSQGVDIYQDEPLRAYFFLKLTPNLNTQAVVTDVLNIFKKNGYKYFPARTGAKATKFTLVLGGVPLVGEQVLFKQIEDYLISIDYKGSLPKRGRKPGSKNKPVLIPVSSTPLPKNDEIVLPDGSIVKAGDIFIVKGETEKYTILDIDQDKGNVKIQSDNGRIFDVSYQSVDEYFSDGTYIKKGVLPNPVTTSSNTSGVDIYRPGFVYVNMSDIRQGDFWKIMKVIGFSKDAKSPKIQVNLLSNGGSKDRISKDGFLRNLETGAYISAYQYYSNQPTRFLDFIQGVDNSVWKENNFTSGSEITSSDANQVKYIIGVSNLISWLDINNLQFTAEEKISIRDILVDENYHNINSFLGLYGFYGKEAYDLVSNANRKFPNKYLNPDFFKPSPAETPKPTVAEDSNVESVIIDKGEDLASKKKKLEEQLENMIFVRSTLPEVEFERRTNVNTIIDKTQKDLNDVVFRMAEIKNGQVDLIDSLFEQAVTPLQNRYDNVYAKRDVTDYFAPNGSPSVYTVDVYERINSPEFKAWFGNYSDAFAYRNVSSYTKNHSLVLTENYEPKVVWHGTGQEFSYFNFDSFPAAYFAENFYYSEWFAIQRGGNGYVLPFFINIRKPLDLTLFGIKPVKNTVFFDYIFLKTGLQESQLKMNPIFLSKSAPPVQAWVYLRQNPQFLVQLAESHVFDGIVYYEDNPANPVGAKDYETKAYIIFKPEQAKLADPQKGELTFASMKSFMLKKGGVV